MIGLTLAGAEGEHGWLALACWTSSHHQNLVETGGLQLRQPQGLLTARDTNCMPTPHHCSHFIDLTHIHRQTATQGDKYKHMTKNWKNRIICLSVILHNSVYFWLTGNGLRNNPCEISVTISNSGNTESCCQQSLNWYCCTFIVRVSLLLKQTQENDQPSVSSGLALRSLFNEQIIFTCYQSFQTKHSCACGKKTWHCVFFPHLTVFDKISVDWTPSITSCPPLQVVQIRLVSLWRADDDRRLRGGTVTTSIRRQVDRVAFVFGQEELVALVALHGVERWWSLRQHTASGARLRICQGEKSVSSKVNIKKYSGFYSSISFLYILKFLCIFLTLQFQAAAMTSEWHFGDYANRTYYLLGAATNQIQIRVFSSKCISSHFWLGNILRHKMLLYS